MLNFFNNHVTIILALALAAVSALVVSFDSGAVTDNAESSMSVIKDPNRTNTDVAGSKQSSAESSAGLNVTDTHNKITEYAPVEKTGQITCYTDNDIEVNCNKKSVQGQDGGLQKGVSWPVPRFVDNGDGSVTDKLTGLIWLKKANCFETSDWAIALSDANGLADSACGLTDGSIAGDWRLPNVKELQSLIDFEYYNPALSNGDGMDKWSEEDIFSGVQSYYYWSSTTHSRNTFLAWYVGIGVGYVNYYDKAKANYVWPVKGGR